MAEDFNLPHWTIRDPLPSAQGEAKGFDNALSNRTDAIHENFESFVSQTAKRFRDLAVHPPEEALGEVSTTSASYVSLSGGPTFTIQCRAGLMIAVLAEAEVKASGGSASFAVRVDGVTADICCGDSGVTSATYVRRLSSRDTVGAAWPQGQLAVFPATATSHTLDMIYLNNPGGANTSFYRNRRLWAWVI